MFKVLFFGTYVPVQGTEYIVRAAKILEKEDIKFTLAGKGQEKEKAVALAGELGLSNILFYDMLTSDRLREEILNADVVLGNFGDTPLAPLIVSNKVYQALAMQKAVITSDMPANRELFDEGDVLMIPVANPLALAKAIMLLKNDRQLGESLARQGHAKFLAQASPQVLGRELKEIIEKLL